MLLVVGSKVHLEPNYTWPNVPVEDLQDDDVEVRKTPSVKFAQNALQIDLLL